MTGVCHHIIFSYGRQLFPDFGVPLNHQYTYENKDSDSGHGVSGKHTPSNPGGTAVILYSQVKLMLPLKSHKAAAPWVLVLPVYLLILISIQPLHISFLPDTTTSHSGKLGIWL